MVMVVDTETHTQQRTVLTRLLELAGEQRQALDHGDIAALEAISSLRDLLVQAAAPFVPPHRPWDPSLEPLAAELQRVSDNLQQELLEAMKQVRNDMQELSKREHVLDYIPGNAPQQRRAWNG